MSTRGRKSPDNRTLILLRHGKSAYPPGVRDLERPLAARGRREAGLAGAWIAEHLPPIDRIICSTAVRTRQTLKAASLSPSPASVDYTDEVYEAYPDELLSLVRAAKPADRTLLLVGHAPGLPWLAERLSGPGSDSTALEMLEAKFPTSAIAVIAVNGEWVETGERTSKLVRFVVPRA